MGGLGLQRADPACSARQRHTTSVGRLIRQHVSTWRYMFANDGGICDMHVRACWRGAWRCIFARYGEYATCMCAHAGGAHMPASDRVASRARKARMAKWGFAGHSLRIWLKISHGNAWRIPYHRNILPNSREVPSDAAGRPPWRGHVRFKQDQRFRSNTSAKL